MNQSPFRIWAVAVIFLIIIAFPFLNDLLKIVPDTGSTENRTMATRPEITLAGMEEFPTRYEEYFDDAFPFRARMVKYYNRYKIRLLQRSPFPDRVIIGDEGWLFTAGDEDAAFRNKDPFTPEELEAYRLELEYRTHYLQKLGCQFYFMIAPVKASVYHEYLPNHQYIPSHMTKGEHLLEYLKQHSTVKTIDVYPAIREAKTLGPVYFRQDTHWNELGAVYAADQALRVVQLDLPNAPPLGPADFRIWKLSFRGGNLVQMLGDPDLETEEIGFHVEPRSGFRSSDVPKTGYPVTSEFWEHPQDYEVNREIKDSTKPRMLLIADSFGAMIFPFLSEGFSRSVKIFDGWQYMLNEDIVRAEKPDVVILMIHEARLKLMLSHQSRLTANR
jgi:alginate O-acetyltransferase complex protein AlgJ